MKTASDYSAVSTNPDERSSSTEDFDSQAAKGGRKTSGSAFSNGLYILCLACCIFNTVVMWRNRSTAVVDPQLLDVSTLDRPSVYVGLDKVKWSPERLQSIPDVHNFPSLITQVSNSYPDKVFPMDARRSLNDRGTSKDEQQVLITADVSTVVQFRILDYEMERCAVTFEIPDADEIRNRHTDINLDMGGITKVQVWELDTNRELDARAVNKRSLPPRKTLVDTLQLKMGNATSTTEFPCKARTLHTYELTCEAEDCRVMFWQDKDAPCLAVYMLQKSSLYMQK